MKLICFILFAGCMVASARTGAQTVTIDVKNATLEKVFSEIRKQSGYEFIAPMQLIKSAPKVTVRLQNASISDVLNACLKDAPLSYEIDGKTIIIKQKVQSSNGQISTINNELPPINVKGRIVNENGEPILASIQVKGSNKGTNTNSDGYFELKAVEDNATLIITASNIETKEIQLNGRSDLAVVNVKMKNSPLDEMQVIAYGTKSKRFQTGNVGSVKASEIEKQPLTNPILALQGRVPGLTVTQSNGISGSAVTVRVQGRNNLNTFFTGSDPLMVVDGVPYPSQKLLTVLTGAGLSNILGPRTGEFDAAGSTLALINPDDIESIEVLKDADATAIYGSRAANGAILITTKKGRSGEPKVELNFQTGWGKVTHTMDLLNTRQYLEMRHEAKTNNGNEAILSTDYDLNGTWDTTRYTDWQKELIGGTARFTRASSTISGGNAFTKYLVGGSYSKETTVYPGDFSNRKASVHFNITSSAINNRLQMQLTGSFLSDHNNVPGIDFTEFIGLAPVAPSLYKSDGTLNWAPDGNGISTWDNPLSYNYNLFENKSTNLIGNGVLSYRILPGLDIKTNLGYNQLQTSQFMASLDAAFRPETRSTLTRFATFVDNTIKSVIVEPQLNYSGMFGMGKFDGLIGFTYQQTNSDGVTSSALGQGSDNLLRNIAAATSISAFTINSVYKYNAVFARLNYILGNRYIINLSGRRDGSSRFGPRNQFHDFGAVGFGWIFSEENFVRNNLRFLSYGKLRGSYGVMGNDQIGDYNYMSLYQSTFNGIPYQTIRGLDPAGISNPYLQWEETRKIQLGLDLGFIDDRFLLSANYYRNRSGNSLTNVALPIITGSRTLLDNFDAVIQNNGLELSLQSENIKRNNFTWTSSFNITIPHNKLVSFPNLENSSSADILIVGKPLNIQKTFSFYGIDPQTGTYLFLDSSHKPTSTPSFQTDRISLITTTEKFYGGLTNSFRYKGFQLEFILQFTKQLGWNFLNFGGVPGRFQTFNNPGNQPLTVLDRWQKPGDIAIAPPFTTSLTDPITGDWSFRDASFIRFKNISFSYRLPNHWGGKVGIKDAVIYVNGQNIMTITKYKGLDPETQSLNSLPPLRVVTIGTKLTF